MIIIATLLTSLSFINMTEEQKNQTGIHKLTATEQQALQAWVDTKSTKKKTSRKKAKPPTIQENSQEGSLIHLSDKTAWEIQAQDTPITQSWITPAEIVIAPSEDEAYPYFLTNSLTGSKVSARKQ